MARPKGFETEKALEKAMHLFRQKGYEATSMQEMVLCTGLSCSSLYNIFGEKHALFLAAREFYMTRSRVLLTEVISQPLPRLEIVRVILTKMVDDIVTGNESSCFMVDAATEKADHDEEVALLIRGQYAWSQETFRQLFAEAQRNGEIRPERDPEAIARFIINVIQGMRVTGKVNQRRQAFEDVVNTTMEALL